MAVDPTDARASDADAADAADDESRHLSGLAATALLGAAVGAGLGLLAWQAMRDEESRVGRAARQAGRTVRDSSRRARDAVRHTAGEASDEVRESAAEAAARVAAMAEDTLRSIDRLRERLGDSVARELRLVRRTAERARRGR